MSILWNQMGSTMRSTIFNEWLAKAIRNWHNTARKHIKQNRHPSTITPATSAPGIPAHAMSPVHLLPNYRGEPDRWPTSITKKALCWKWRPGDRQPQYSKFSQKQKTCCRKRGQGCSWTDHHSHSSNSTGQYFLSVPLTWKISTSKNNRGWKILSLGIIVLIWLCNSYFCIFPCSCEQWTFVRWKMQARFQVTFPSTGVGKEDQTWNIMNPETEHAANKSRAEEHWTPHHAHLALKAFSQIQEATGC